MITINGHTFETSEDLGRVKGILPQGRKYIIVYEHGIERVHPALDPERTRLELVHKSSRKIINLRQVKYKLKRRSNDGLCSFNNRPDKTP